MSDTLKVIRIFIGSPGGLDAERQAAHDVIESVNRSHSERWGCHLKLLGWESAIPGYVRPQSKINEDLDRCDYFLGVLWDKWGSRPSNDIDGYTSGFEEEFVRAKKRIEDGLMRDMAIYFKDVEVPQGMEPGEEIKKVLTFRTQCIDEKRVFFKGFENVQDFRDVVRAKLEEIGWQETEIFRQIDQQKGQSENTPSRDERSEEPVAQEEWLIEDEAREFLSNMLQRTPEWEATMAHEIARIRLIASALTRSGNDDTYLGNHDANKIFQSMRDKNLSAQEIRALNDCGLVGFEHQNVPLWRWIAKGADEGDLFGRTSLLATVGNEREKKNSIEVLEIADQPIPVVDGLLDKKQVLESWLSDDTNNQVFEAVVSFLSSNADVEDIPLLEEVAANCSLHRRGKIEAAIIGILSQSSPNIAIERLVENDVDAVGERVVKALFASPQSLPTETMAKCLSAKQDIVRHRAAQILFERDEIVLDVAETLLTDSNFEIRLVAAETLKKLGKELGDEVVKNALTIVKKTSGFGLFQRTETDATHHDRYLSNRLAELSFAALQQRIAEAGVFDHRELSALYSKFTSKVQHEIRENLVDGFAAHFDAAIKKQVDAGKLDPDTVSRVRKLEEFQRKQLCTQALTAFCGIGKAKDLDLVRTTLDGYEVEATENILNFLARFGNWSDIERIKKLEDYPFGRGGLLSINVTKLPTQKARAILTIGKMRIADILELDLDVQILRSLAKQLPKSMIAKLSDEILLREMNRKDGEYRIIFALRCVQSLSKSRVSSLLDAYVDSNSHRYYNSVHWLDLGASLPQRLVKTIVERKLAQH
nr:hypothetical protein [Amylibacter sp.]